MRDKKRLFIYPNTSETYRVGGNSYIRNLSSYLSSTFTIINKQTTLGLLDVLLKLPKCDVLYFNWIEDIPDRRFGFLQVPLLIIILGVAKLLRVRIVWFIHNNVSHSRKHGGLKKFIVRLMRSFADVILSHSNEVALEVPRQKLFSFDHPVEAYHPLVSSQPFQYDLLIWGTVSPYKGISEFVGYAATVPGLQSKRILIAGKFNSDAYYEELKKLAPQNVVIRNEVLPETELIKLFAQSRFVLFTYNSPSVLSSAALCKTLSFGKEIVGPRIGAFKELGSKGLLYNFVNFAALEQLMNDLESGAVTPLDKTQLMHYIDSVSWNNFAAFVTNVIHKSFKKN